MGQVGSKVIVDPWCNGFGGRRGHDRIVVGFTTTCANWNIVESDVKHYKPIE